MTDPVSTAVCVAVQTLLGAVGLAGWLLLVLVLRDQGVTVREILSDREKKKVVVILVSVLIVLAPVFALTVGGALGGWVEEIMRQ